MAGPPPPSCFAPVEGKRSADRFVASRLGIKAWSEAMPSCAAARPGVCPCCGAAARPLSGPLVVVGHGLVERQVRGPSGPHEPPVQVQVQLRRYRCRACRAVLVVGPQGPERALVRRGRDRVSAGALRAGCAEHARASVHVPIARGGGLGAGALGDADALGRVSTPWRVVWREAVYRRATAASRGGAAHAPAGSACRTQLGCCSERGRVCGRADRSLISIVWRHGRDTGGNGQRCWLVLTRMLH